MSKTGSRIASVAGTFTAGVILVVGLETLGFWFVLIAFGVALILTLIGAFIAGLRGDKDD